MNELKETDEGGIYASRRDRRDAPIAGVRVEWEGDQKILHSVASPAAAAAIRSSIGPKDEQGLRQILSGLAMPTEWVEKTMQNREMLFAEDGTPHVQPKFSGLTQQNLSHVIQTRPKAGLPELGFCDKHADDVDHNHAKCGKYHEGDYLWPEQTADGKGKFVDKNDVIKGLRKDKVKVYSLQQLIVDKAVSQKFGIEGTLLQTLVRRALVDPVGAATAMQNAIREAGYPHVVVDAGGFVKSRTAAVAALKQAATHLPSMAGAVPCSIIGDLIFMHHPDYGVDSPWVVGGPSKYIESVKHMHTLAVHWGVATATFLFCYECEMLDLRTADVDNVPSAGIIQHQASDDGIEPWGDAQLDLTVRQRLRLQSLSDQVLPVRRQQDGPVVASAVRVTDQYVLLNDHIFEDAFGDVFVGDEVAAPVHGIAHDLWCAESRGKSVPWLLRDVRVGEKAVLVYSVGPNVEVSSEVVITSVSGRTILLSKPPEVRAGVSGAALVSLDDFALLGIHCGVTVNNAVACAFNSDMFTLLADHAKTAEVSRSEATSDNDGNVYNAFKRKGLRNVIDRVIETSVPLFDGPEHVAMGTVFGDMVTTVYDPESTRETLSIGKNDPVVWEERPGGLFFGAKVSGSASDTGHYGPALVRRVTPGEDVVVVGRDERSPYFSEVVKVRHVSVAAVSFMLSPFVEDGLPLIGGMVVAVRDGAVVGVYTGPVADKRRGILGGCQAFRLRPVSGETSVDLVGVMASKFPMLTLMAWDRKTLEGVFSHKSHAGTDDMLSYAMIGDSIAKVETCRAYLAHKLPYGRWTIRNSKYLSNESMALKCRELGLHAYVKTGLGVSLSDQSSVYADLLEALIGVASCYETPEVLTKFCQVLVPGLSALANDMSLTPRVDTFGFAPEECASP